MGSDPRKLPPALARLMAGEWKKGAIPLKWDGKTASTPWDIWKGC
ncbi:MAG TPA: hypothetical protein PKN47_22090 [Nitrospira sp.]|jgi:UDP-N-acetylglucosamine 2-epimerase (non-hydrolysing)|nr:hypothetical protein [Nitrospira sp.]